MCSGGTSRSTSNMPTLPRSRNIRQMWTTSPAREAQKLTAKGPDPKAVAGDRRDQRRPSCFAYWHASACSHGPGSLECTDRRSRQTGRPEPCPALVRCAGPCFLCQPRQGSTRSGAARCPGPLGLLMLSPARRATLPCLGSDSSPSHSRPRSAFGKTGNRVTVKTATKGSLPATVTQCLQAAQCGRKEAWSGAVRIRPHNTCTRPVCHLPHDDEWVRGWHVWHDLGDDGVVSPAVGYIRDVPHACLWGFGRLSALSQLPFSSFCRVLQFLSLAFF